MFSKFINPMLEALGFNAGASRMPEPEDTASQITQTESAFRDRSIDSQKINFVGGIMNFGKLSFNDDEHSGYYISNQGIYFGNGAGSDETFLKYVVSTGLFQLYGAADINLFGGGGIRIDNPVGSSNSTPLVILNRTSSPAVDITQAVIGDAAWFTANDGKAAFFLAASGGEAVTENQQITAVDSDFYRMQRYSNGSIGITHWLADNADPNGVLTGDGAGDVCYSTDGNVYRCTGGTTWVAM